MGKLWFKKYCENTYLHYYKVKNAFGTIYQITCFSVWKNIIMCLICVGSLIGIEEGSFYLVTLF